MMWCSACSCFHEIWNVPKEWIHFYKQIQEKCSCTRIKILIHPDSVMRLLSRKCQLSQSSCRIPAYFFLFKLLYSLTYSFIRERPHFSVFLPALCLLDFYPRSACWPSFYQNDLGVVNRVYMYDDMICVLTAHHAVIIKNYCTYNTLAF